MDATCLHAIDVSPTTPFAYFKAPSPRVLLLQPTVVEIQWIAEANAKYLVERARGSWSLDFQVVKHIPVSEGIVSFRDVNVNPNTDYRYRVRAVSFNGGPEAVGKTLEVCTPFPYNNEWERVKIRKYPQLLRDEQYSSDVTQHLADSGFAKWETEQSVAADGTLGFNDEKWNSYISRSLDPKPHMKPSPRYGHSASIIGDHMYMYGGISCDSDIADESSCKENDELWRFNREYHTWEQFLVQGPGPRVHHSATTIGNKMLVFGGSFQKKISETVSYFGSESEVIQRSNGRIESFTLGDDESFSESSFEMSSIVYNDIWEMDPGTPQEIVFQGGPVDLVLDEGRAITASAIPLDIVDDGALCISEVTSVQVTFRHSCPGEVSLWLLAPNARNREGDSGMVLLDKMVSADVVCNHNEEYHTLTFSDSALHSMRDYRYGSGAFLPVSRLDRYKGMRYNGTLPWKLRAADVVSNGSPIGDILSWSLKLRVFPCNPAPQWTDLSPLSSPPRRFSHSTLASGDKLYIYGGLSPDQGLLEDLWVFERSAVSWTELTKMKPIGDMHLALKNVVLLPHGLLHLSNDLEISGYRFLTSNWNVLQDKGISKVNPVQRKSFSLVFEHDTDSLLLFGGETGTQAFDDIWRLKLQNLTDMENRLALCTSFLHDCDIEPCKIFDNLWKKVWCNLE